MRAISVGGPDLAGAPSVPHGATARRLDWELLPPDLRALIEQHLGAPVVRAESAGSGFTPGFASTLVGEDGSRMFVKAASKKAQAPFADAYLEEVRKLSALPAGLPVPRLLWWHEDALWVTLGLEYVGGGNPVRPWQEPELAACLDALEELADVLTPAPMPLAPFADDFAHMLLGWEHVRRTVPDWPHSAEAAWLASTFPDATAGSTLVHTDARDDNFLLTARGAVLCDWNWPVLGAAWIDTVCLLLSAHGDGLDADELLAERPLTRDIDPGQVDVLLALLAGYFLERRDQPVPHSSPYLRAHQSWYAEVTWDWLARRRGWS